MTKQPMELVAIDVGGTHARFALASIGADGAIALGEPVTMKTSDHDGLESAWAAFAQACGCALPAGVAIAIAGPVTGDVVRMTNNDWVLHVSRLKDALKVDAVTVLNDFGAVAHAVARAPAAQLVHIAGPDRPLPDDGTISVVGPGTGLGVAYIHRHGGGYRIHATEGGHIGFAPQDEIDDRILQVLRARHGRVATERVNAGPGIAEIYAALGGTDLPDDRTIWQRGIAGEDALARLAVERFCASLGTVAGDYALVHGSSAVVLAGGLGLRLREILPHTDFAERFRAKAQYREMMAAMPIKLIVHPQPGLYGAAAAFHMEHGQ